MVSLEFLIVIIFPVALWPWSRLSLQQKWVPEIFPRGLRRPVLRADNLNIFMCRLSWNLGASNSWNLQGLSRIVMGLLYLCSWSKLHKSWDWQYGHIKLITGKWNLNPLLRIKIIDLVGRSDLFKINNLVYDGREIVRSLYSSLQEQRVLWWV